MRLLIETNYNYFCCSTLPLLNGDIKDIVDSYGNGSFLENVYKDILDTLKYYYYKSMPRKIKREFKRMIRLYEFRLKELSWYQ